MIAIYKKMELSFSRYFFTSLICVRHRLKSMRGWFGYEQCKRMKAGKNTISIFLLFALVWHNTHGEAVSPTSPTPTAPTPATPTAKGKKRKW